MSAAVGDASCIFFGDSITAGQFIDPAYRWTTLVQQRLPELQCSVEAVSGDTTRLALERFDVIQRQRPDILVIQFGLNDCNRWQSDNGLQRVSEDAFRANIEEMIERARHFGVSRVTLMTSHPTTRSAEYESDRRWYNQIVRSITFGKADLLDIEARFPAGYDLPPLLMDGLHLSRAGHVVYANLVAEFLGA